jgi:hypothetical protein
LTGIEPMTLAAHIPPLLGLAGVWLVLGVGMRVGLQLPLVAAAVACYALHAFTQYQFGVGALDHHGAEQLAVLGALLLGLMWLRRSEAVVPAAILGLWLGLSLGVHASLVVLQLPLLLALLVQWIRDESPPPRASLGFACGLITGVTPILLPAETFWQGRFDLYYLSWLQLYASVATGVIVASLSRWPCTRRTFIAIGAMTVGLAIPLVATLKFTMHFVAGDLPGIAQIDEVRSPFTFLEEPSGLRRLNQVYTMLIWLAPFVCVISAAMVIRERDFWLRYFWAWSAFGLAAVVAQVRLGSLGVVFLYLPLLVLLQRVIGSRWDRRQSATVAIMAVLVIAYMPTLLFQLPGKRIPAMSESYSSIRSVVPALADACAKEPGVVLATPGDGHIVRFFTNCAVIANSFRLTGLDVQKVSEAVTLISRPAATLTVEARGVRYVLARLIPPAEVSDPVLFDELLNPQAEIPAGYRPIVQAGVSRPDGSRRNFLGVFEVATLAPASSPGT